MCLAIIKQFLVRDQMYRKKKTHSYNGSKVSDEKQIANKKLNTPRARATELKIFKNRMVSRLVIDFHKTHFLVFVNT